MTTNMKHCIMKILPKLRFGFLTRSTWQHQVHRNNANCLKSSIRQHNIASVPIRFCSQHVYSMKKVNLVTPLFLRAEKFLDRTAVVDQNGTYTYSDVLHFTNELADKICNYYHPEKSDIKGERIAFLCPNDVSYVISQWAVWMSGGVAVPLSKSYPPSELEYFIGDTQSRLIITTEEFYDVLKPLSNKLGVHLMVLNKSDYSKGPVDITEVISLEQVADADSTHSLDDSDQKVQRAARSNRLTQLIKYNKFKHRNSLIIYTSGTTGKPKGVLHTHGSIQAQMEDMIWSWGWTSNDVILHALPLHHVHGIVNVLMTPLFCGATCVMLPKFDAKKVWSMLLSPMSATLPRSINVFMAVPTVYAKLIENYEQRLLRGRGTKQAREYVRAVCSHKVRLMVSGSAALPQPVMERWEEITGHQLLERYGMTEIGMGLTNPLKGPRVPGCVGLPFPKVEVAIARPNAYAKHGYDLISRGNSNRTKIVAGTEGEEGELLVKGPNVFQEYWGKPEATKQAFTDGWFKTGDSACYSNGVYKILGRMSVDIIKSGGYKISALDIERHLLSHPDITDVAVVGLPDISWGQKVAAVVVFRTGVKPPTLTELQGWAAERMASYQIPSTLKVLDAMPRNAIGKVNKKELLGKVFAKEMKPSLP